MNTKQPDKVTLLTYFEAMRAAERAVTDARFVQMDKAVVLLAETTASKLTTLIALATFALGCGGLAVTSALAIAGLILTLIFRTR